jgi:autotransporter-associated beta strand protein
MYWQQHGRRANTARPRAYPAPSSNGNFISSLTGALAAINLPTGAALTIAGADGAGDKKVQTIDGGGTQGGFLIDSGNVTLADLAFGSGIFLQGNQTLTLGAPTGDTLTISGVIADQTGSGGTGAGSLIINQGSSGTVVLSAANTYTGGTTLEGGKLELGTALSAGNRAITLDGPATLQIDGTISGTQTFANTLSNMMVGDQIDLTGLTFDAAQPFAVAPTSTALTVQGTNGAEIFRLQNPATRDRAYAISRWRRDCRFANCR